MAPPKDLDELLERKRYPGMTRFESIITRDWLLQAGERFDSIDFNVRLGTGRDPGPDFPEFIRRDAILLTQKRADIIATSDGRVTIAEVKIQGKLSAVGQLLGYKVLYREAHPNGARIIMLLIARDVDPDIDSVLIAQGIQVVIIPRVFPGTERRR